MKEMAERAMVELQVVEEEVTQIISKAKEDLVKDIQSKQKDLDKDYDARVKKQKDDIDKDVKKKLDVNAKKMDKIFVGGKKNVNKSSDFIVEQVDKNIGSL